MYAELLKLPDSNPPGLIIDLRRTLGGVPAPRLLSPLFKEQTVVGYVKNLERGETLPFRTDTLTKSYAGPVVALTSPYCRSSCDMFAQFLGATGRATLIGEPPAGAARPLARKPLPYGYVLAISQPGESLNVNMQIVEGNPAEVDHLVAPTQADLAAGRDPALEQALELLNDQ